MMKDKDDQVSKLSTKQIVSWFVASMHSTGSFGADRVNNSVALLKRVPATRHAVLQWFTQLFEEATKCCMDGMDYSGAAYSMSQDMNASIQIVVHTLNDFLEKNSEAWAPILCEWSVESLGQISSSFKQGSAIAGTSQPSRKLNELVAFWLQAFSTRMLMNIYRYCLKSLIDGGAESCMDSLLATSARHAPNFDWVVADVGNTFPSEIINRVLRTGFRDFAKQQWGQQPMEEGESETKSVVRILEHLSKRHADRVRKAMIELYQNPSVSDGLGQVKVILYVMQLLSDSPLLIKISTKTFIELLDDRNLNMIYTQYSKLPDFKSNLESVCSLAVHLICQSSDSSFRLIQLLLRASSNQKTSKGLDKPVREIFSQVMTSLFQDLLRIAMRKRGVTSEKTENGVVVELKSHYKQLCDELLSSGTAERQEWILTLMKIVSVRGCVRQVLSRLLMEISAQTDIHLFLKLYTFITSIVPVLLEKVLDYSFSLVLDGQLDKRQTVNLLKNLRRLLSRSVEMPGSYEVQSRLHVALWNHTKDLCMHVCNSQACEEAGTLSVYIIAILLTSTIPRMLEVTLFPLSQTLVWYFFHLLHLGKANNDSSMKSCRRALVHLSQTSESFAIVCQFVLESSVTQANAILFGRRTEVLKGDEDGAPNTSDMFSEQKTSLLSQHRAHVASASVIDFTPIVVETGLIGSGPKKKKSCPLSKSAQVTNNECISLLIHRCCCKTGSSGSLEGGVIHNTSAAFDEDKLIVLGTKLFEAVTSCMQGSLLHADSPWPEPGFRKYAVERDLRIFTFLDEHPFAWNILNLLANSPKALWKCSLILRAVSGAVLHHWESSRDSSASQSECHLLHSIKVIETLGKGQLLPEPLKFIGEIFHLLSPYEVFLMMTDAWKFIHDHPLPATDSWDSQHKRDFSSEGINVQPYLARTHSILHANIAKMGHLFARFVPRSERDKLTTCSK